MNITDATILVVDDEPELLEIFALWLGRSGCKVLTAPNGAEAIKILTDRPVDALISDIRMPVMDGITLVRRLFELQIQVPSIIFVSGFGDIDAREMYSLGVEAMLPKPLKRQVLLKALEDSLKERQELWRTPLESVPQKILYRVEPSLSEAAHTCGFQVGRGGCCFTWNEPLAEDTPVQLAISFVREGLKLEGHGCVRWYSSADSHIGIEFEYLAPECRDWVIEQMRGKATFSFIPRC